MKILKMKKTGQSLMEFVLIGLLVSLVSFWSFYKLNPAFFKSFVKGSIAGTANVNGQMEMQAMGD